MLDKVIAVLDEYEKNYSISEVESLLERWQEGKRDLISILSKHPNWNEELKCIVFDYKEIRNNDRRHSSFSDLNCYVQECMTIDDEVQKLLNEFYSWGLNQFVDDELISCINNVSTLFNFKSGQKTSRAVNKIFTSIDGDKLDKYNAMFAIFADNVNPISIDRKAVLSVNPLDYLQMSKGSGWKSCHNLTNGCYQAGVLSYLQDSTSLIFFTIEDDEENVQAAQKITRQIFAYADGKLLQSRLYPSEDEATRLNYRNIVQAVFAECLESPNLWSLQKLHDEILKHVIHHEDSLLYPDFLYDCYKKSLSTLKDFPQEGTPIIIGSTCYCLECGSVLLDSEKLTCCSGHKCTDCGCNVSDDDVIWIDGEVYCSDCVRYCPCCDEYTRQQMTDVVGRHDQVCENCLENFYQYCEGCGTYWPTDDCSWVEEKQCFYCEDCYTELDLDDDEEEFDEEETEEAC